MKVGLALPHSSRDQVTWPDIAALARRAEAAGVDSLWLYDHFVIRRDTEPPYGFHEAWTLLAALAAITERVELGTLVLATSFRGPGLLAKMTAAADEVSGGRIILGLGCGWHEPEYRAFDYPFDHRVGRFEEALQIIVPLLRGKRVTHAGRWNTVDDAVLDPAPSRTTTPIMVAAKGERMLRLTARHADAWNAAWFGLPDERFAERRAALVEACHAEGRDPDGVEVTAGLSVAAPDGSSLGGPGSHLPLDSRAIADGLAAWTEAGVGHVQIDLRAKTPDAYEVAFDGINRYRG